ncbi:hypothetical protein DFS34DRAFT_321289 [Phlyctochytrium arcticum]|nr:hypothetical protein DFS34DRAFT_321289 [Phlyctochytrium arcticum]
MSNVTGKRCLSEFCDPIVAKSQRDHCFPDEPVSRNFLIKENAVRKFIEPWLKDGYPDLLTTFNKRVAGGCSLKRPYQYVDALTHCVFGEMDEDQHESYDPSCENQRLMMLMTDVATRPCALIRSNTQRKRVLPARGLHEERQDTREMDTE